MSVVEGGRPLSKWSQFWIGTIQFLSCGMCSRESIDSTSIDPLPSTRENSKQYSIEPSGEKADTVLPAPSQAVTVFPATPQVLTPHSPYVEGQTTCLMDLPDDCLLEIIDRLSFLDRMRFRVNKRLNAIEPHATAITNTADRHRLHYAEFYVVEDRVQIINRRTILLPAISGLIMLLRIIKCCTLDGISGVASLAYIRRISNMMRFMKANDRVLVGTEETGTSEDAVAMQPYVECMRNNEKMRLALYMPQNWTSIDQLLILIEEAQKLRRTLSLYALNLTTAQQLARHIFGIDPSIFENRLSDVTEIHTSIKDREIYINLDSQNMLDICWMQGLMKTAIRHSFTNHRDMFNLKVDKVPFDLSNYARVSYKEEQ